MSFAVAQPPTLDGDVERNVAQHVELVEVSALAGAEWILFPELSLTGYVIDDAARLALRVDDPRLAPLQRMVDVLHTAVIAGAPVRNTHRGTLELCALVFRSGKAPLVVPKQRLGAFGASARVDLLEGRELPSAESSVFVSGGRRNPLVLGRSRVAIAICADSGDPAHAARAAAQDATVYAASMFVIPSEYDAEATRLRDYARQHGMWVAMANHGAPTGGLRSAGRSAVWTDEGVCVEQAPTEGRALTLIRAR